ncbi:MAG TPA: cytochrome c peroxidase [Methylomirabilota bacterium]|nr:cytochrome c peroxidase [Methylomirabilota bacterium]
MRRFLFAALLGAGLVAAAWAVVGSAALAADPPLGLPPVPIPENNPMTPEKITLGEKLYNEKRFSTTGDVGCVTCHDPKKAFTDSPLRVSEGIEKKTGTRNSPTTINAVYMTSQFWDGRSPDLEDQALHPFVNPVEHGLASHEPILEIVRTDPEYVRAFDEVFGTTGEDITIREVTLAIAAFERTIVSGNSPFDRWYYGGEEDALTEQQKRGFELFINEGRCVSCHVIEQTQALFTDNRFHNIGVGINDIQDQVPELAGEFLDADLTLSEVDVEVLTDPRTSELGRFAISHGFGDLGSFKTPTLRNVALTAPYMHDGSIETLEEVVIHYMNGGVTEVGDPVNDFLSSGIRPLDIETEDIEALVAFMEALTSPEIAAQVEAAESE